MDEAVRKLAMVGVALLLGAASGCSPGEAPCVEPEEEPPAAESTR